MKKKKGQEAVNFSISLPRDYIEALDNFSLEMDMSRSQVMKRALIGLWEDVSSVNQMVEFVGADPAKVRRSYRKLGLRTPEDSSPPSRYLDEKKSSARSAPRGKTAKA